jgi:hypothetical protein
MRVLRMMDPSTVKPQGTEKFPVAGRFHLIQVVGSLDPRDCKSFTLRTGFRYVQVRFKTSLTVY